LIGAAVWLSVTFGSREIQRLNQQVADLEQEKRRLVEYASRLAASRRVGQLDVVRQERDADGRVVNTLLWQEIGSDGLRGKPIALETVGEIVYVEALVIKFQHNLVAEGDPQRGVSLALFRRVFGSAEAPDSVPEIGREARPPQAADVPFQRELWDRFWDLASDAELASKYGVRVAQIEAPGVRVTPGEVWEVALDAAGGLNLRWAASIP
jgi:hypothetical protein